MDRAEFIAQKASNCASFLRSHNPDSMLSALLATTTLDTALGMVPTVMPWVETQGIPAAVDIVMSHLAPAPADRAVVADKVRRYLQTFWDALRA
jgi:hypothetical protein